MAINWEEFTPIDAPAAQGGNVDWSFFEPETSGFDAKMVPEQFKSGIAGLQSGFFANNAKNSAALLNSMDRIDRGEKLPMDQDPLGYQDMDAEQRAQMRAQFDQNLTGNVAKAVKYNAEQQTYARNPMADQLIQLANEGDYAGAWKTFKNDPAGIIQQLSVESAPNALPSLAGGGIGVLLKGGVPALMAGLATGSYPVEYIASITDSLRESGVDMNDVKAVEAKLRDPQFIEDAGKRATTRGTAIAAMDALSGKLLMPLKAGQFGGNVARGVANIGIDTGTEMGGEAAAQVLSGEKLRVGDVLAEGLGAGPQSVAGTALKTMATPKAEIEQQPTQVEEPAASPILALENKPDPLIAFPDGSVGRQSDVDNFIASLPENQRIDARARLYGLGSQPVETATVQDITAARSGDEAIAAFESAVSAPTEIEQSLKNEQIDAAWRAYIADVEGQRQRDFEAAEQARREADIPKMEAQLADQQVERADILTQAQGFDVAEPTAMQLAMEAARAKLEGMRQKTKQEKVQAPNELILGVERTKPATNNTPAIADSQQAAPAVPDAVTATEQKSVTGNPLMDNPASWVIRERETGKVVMETFDPKKVEALNTERYEAVPAYQHLAEINDPNSLAAWAATGEEIKAESKIVAPSRESTLPQPMPESEVTAGEAPDAGQMVDVIEKSADATRLHEGKGGIVIDEEVMQRRNLAEYRAGKRLTQAGMDQQQLDMLSESILREAEASFDKDGKFIGKGKYRFVPKNSRGSIYMFDDLTEAKSFADSYRQKKSTESVEKRKRIGKGERGQTIFENEQGIRSYTESGFKYTEEAGKPRGSEFKTVIELQSEAKTTAAETSQPGQTTEQNVTGEDEPARDQPKPEETEQEAEEKQTANIQDFGEKIGGARKDVWTSFKDDLNAIADDDIAAQPLSKIWPAPDYQKLIDGGMNVETVAIVRALRDEVPAKPRNAWKVKRWAEQVKMLRGFANDVMDGNTSTAKLRSEMNRAGTILRGVNGRIDLYMEVGHAKSLEGIRFQEHFYSLYKGQENVRLWVVEKDAAATAFSNWPHEIATGNTKEEAIANFKAKYDTLNTDNAAKQPAFDIFSKNGTKGFFIGKKIGRNYATLAGPFASVKEARQYRDENSPALQEKLEKFKEIPRERRDVNEPRVGEDMRNGQDVTPEMFGETFGFRGVEFGNWVEQKRRQKDLNDAFDALMDMAAVLGVPPKALSLNGQLGLAFGARGSGGVNPAAAHYEYGKVVINLTKRTGAGSLGHEWWHALDNYFSRMREKGDAMMTEALDVSLAARGSNYQHQGAVRREMIDAFGDVVRAIKNTALKARSSKLDAKRSKEYWTTGLEMSARAFESYLISKLQDQNASNDYLANIVDEETWKAAESLGFELDDSYPYPTAGEIPGIRAGFDKFFQTIETRQSDDGKIALFSQSSETGGMLVSEVNRALTRLRAKWIGFTRVNAVQSVADLPAELRNRVNPDAQTEGFYDPQTKSVYLIADNIASTSRAVWVAAHEVVGHGGLRMLKDKSVNEALNLAGQNTYIRKLADAIKREHGDMSEQVAIEEAIAETAAAIETGDFQGIKNRYGIDAPANIKVQQGLVSRVLEAVRKFLASVMGKAEVSDADVRGLIRAQMDAVEAEDAAQATAETAEQPLQSRAPQMPEWLKQLPKEAQDAAKKAGIWAEQKPLKERLKDLRNDAVKKIQQGLVDQFAPLKELGEREYILARLTKSSDAPLESLLMYGKPFLNDAGAVDVKMEKGGLIGSLQQLQGEHDRFFAWIAGNRASKLKAQGRENLFTDTDITALKDLNQGKMSDGKSRAMLYLKVLNEFNAYSKSVLDIAEKAGIINGQDRQIWESDFYVPFYRVMEDQEFKGPKNVSGMVNQYAFKKLKGGTDNLNDLMQNTLRNWSHLLSASLKNQAASAAISTAEKAGIAVPVGTKQKGSVTVLEAGKEKHYMIDDPFIMDAITSLEWAGWNNPTMKWMQQAKHYLTLGVTISPTFKIRNLMRDQMAAIGLNPISYNLLNNLAEGWKGTDKESAQYAKMLTGGGLMRFGTFLEDDRADHMKRLINDGVKASTILDTKAKVKDALKAGFDWWQEVGDRSENITRATIYKQRYEQAIQGGMSDDEAHLMASFAARDSMDFSLQGHWASVRFLTQLVPFMNARLQGLYKLGRDGIMPSGRMLAPQLFGNQQVGDKAKAMRFGAVTGTVALASIALMLAYRDDDDWKNREEWDRDTYWWFKIGDTAYRIPKPFEIGAIGTLAERSLEVALNGMDKESRKLFLQRLGAMISQTFSMNPVPQLVKPLVDLYANTDSFTGRPIETMGMERLSKSERIGQNTSATAQAIGKATSLVGLSPVQVDFLVDSYFAWLGTHLVMTADFAVRPMMGLPEKPARRWPDDYFVIGDFAKDLPANQSKYITKFYEQSQEVQQAMADIRYYQSIGNTVKARELMDENRDKVSMYRMYNDASKRLADINKRIKIIQAKNIDPIEKRDQIDRLTQMKIRVTRLTEEKRLSRQRETQE